MSFRVTKDITADYIQTASLVSNGSGSGSVARIVKTVAQSIPDTTETNVTAYNTTYTSDTFFTVNATNGTISFTVPANEQVAVLFTVRGAFALNATGARVLNLKSGASAYDFTQTIATNALAAQTVAISNIQVFTVAGTYTYFLSVQQNSTAALNLSSVNFSVTRIL